MSKQAAKKKKNQKRLPSLLVSLEYLSAHYGRAKTPRALVSGLAFDGKNMGSDLFCEAANRIHIRTKVTRYKNIASLQAALLPAVMIAHDEKAYVLIARDGDVFEIYDTQSKAKEKRTFAELEEDYAGYIILTQPTAAFSKVGVEAKKSENEGHWFWDLANQNRGIYIMVLLGAVFINLFGLASPLFIMNVYDRVIPNEAIETGWALGIGALTVFVFDFIMRTLRGYLIDLAGRRIDVIATRRIYDQLLNMKLSQRPRSAGVFANMLKDFDSVRDFFTSATITTMVDLPFTIFFLFIIYKLGGSVALILLGLIAFAMMVGLLLQVPLKSVVRKSTRSAEAKHGILIETIHGLETIKAIGADGAFRAKYGAYVGESSAYGQASRFISGFGVHVATFVQQTASIFIVLAGMYMVASSDMSSGALIACVILSGRALSPIGQIANLMTRYHQANVSLKALEEIMSKPVERPAGKNFLHRPDLEGKIAFERVSFSYPSIKREVIGDLSFTINPGEKVAILGRIGSGKSTCARLMMGLYEPDAGTILADDTDYRQIDPADLRKSIAYIAQDVVLFSGSVRDNISASVPSASDEEILQAAKSAGVHDFISRYPQGYDTPVGEHGEGLSGGQRQAIALARAMLIKPKVLICDEPTNAMDIQAEMAFKHYVANEVKDKTLILVTHKHSMLELVDRIIVLEQGQLAVDGPREKVLEFLRQGQTPKEAAPQPNESNENQEGDKPS